MFREVKSLVQEHTAGAAGHTLIWPQNPVFLPSLEDAVSLNLVPPTGEESEEEDSGDKGSGEERARRPSRASGNRAGPFHIQAGGKVLSVQTCIVSPLWCRMKRTAYLLGCRDGWPGGRG